MLILLMILASLFGGHTIHTLDGGDGGPTQPCAIIQETGTNSCQ